MDDTLTITFILSAGQTPRGNRPAITAGMTLWHEVSKAAFDPSLEDLGVGNILDDADIAAVSVSWIDDYDDSEKPFMNVTGFYHSKETANTDGTKRPASEIFPRSVQVPYFPTGTNIIEWIVGYMQENVYHQKDYRD